MSRVYYDQQVAYEDEPCLNLAEVNLVSPDSRGWFRYQVVVLLRGNELKELRNTMGLMDDFKANQFRVMGGVWDGECLYIEHNLGELRDIADRMRGRPTFDIKELTRSN